MIKIIETNINFADGDNDIVVDIPYDVQSRVIEVDNWDDYVKEIENQEQVNRVSIIGNVIGVSFPKGATIKAFNNTNKSLVCVAELYNGRKIIKTAYVV